MLVLPPRNQREYTLPCTQQPNSRNKTEPGFRGLEVAGRCGGRGRGTAVASRQSGVLPHGPTGAGFLGHALRVETPCGRRARRGAGAQRERPGPNHPSTLALRTSKLAVWCCWCGSVCHAYSFTAMSRQKPLGSCQACVCGWVGKQGLWVGVQVLVARHPANQSGGAAPGGGAHARGGGADLALHAAVCACPGARRCRPAAPGLGCQAWVQQPVFPPPRKAAPPCAGEHPP